MRTRNVWAVREGVRKLNFRLARNKVNKQNFNLISTLSHPRILQKNQQQESIMLRKGCARAMNKGKGGEKVLIKKFPPAALHGIESQIRLMRLISLVVGGALWKEKLEVLSSESSAAYPSKQTETSRKTPFKRVNTFSSSLIIFVYSICWPLCNANSFSLRRILFASNKSVNKFFCFCFFRELAARKKFDCVRMRLSN